MESSRATAVNNVRVFRLDRERVREHLQRAAARLLAARDDVRGVWLFGSLARGDAAPGSDADLLIVIRDSTEPFLNRSPNLAPHFAGVGIGCDLFVYTEAEVERLRQLSSLVKTALETGIRLGSADSNPDMG